MNICIYRENGIFVLIIEQINNYILMESRSMNIIIGYCELLVIYLSA